MHRELRGRFFSGIVIAEKQLVYSIRTLHVQRGRSKFV